MFCFLGIPQDCVIQFKNSMWATWFLFNDDHWNFMNFMVVIGMGYIQVYITYSSQWSNAGLQKICINCSMINLKGWHYLNVTDKRIYIFCTLYIFAAFYLWTNQCIISMLYMENMQKKHEKVTIECEIKNS